MLQVFRLLQLLELKRLTTLESSDSCSSYSFPLLSLTEFYPILGNFVFIQNSRRPLLISREPCPRYPLRAHLLHVSALNVPASFTSSDSDSSRPLCSAWDPFSLLWSGKCLQAEIQGDHRGYLICFASLKVPGLCAYCCLKQYKNSVFPVFYPVSSYARRVHLVPIAVSRTEAGLIRKMTLPPKHMKVSSDSLWPLIYSQYKTLGMINRKKSSQGQHSKTTTVQNQ